ncbi:MAG: hypothetical protein ACKV2V_07220, partial [Blastocatellia bacterium]
ELWGMLRDINRAARAMSAHMPAMDRKFRLPAQRNETTLLLTARAFAAEAEPLAGDFTRHELPAGFLERLHTLTAEVQADLEQRNGARAAGNQATVSLREAIRQGQLAVRQLNEMMRLKYAREGATLGEWDYVMRPGQASRGARVGKPADDETDNGVAPAPVVEPEVVETRRGRAAGK